MGSLLPSVNPLGLRGQKYTPASRPRGTGQQLGAGTSLFNDDPQD